MSRLTSPNVVIPSATILVAGLLALAFWKLGPAGTDTDHQRSVSGAATRGAAEAPAASGVAHDPRSGPHDDAAPVDGGPAGAPGSPASTQGSQSPSSTQTVVPPSASSGALPGWRKYEPEKPAPGNGTAAYAGSLSSGGGSSSSKAAPAKGPATSTPGTAGVPAFGVRPTTSGVPATPPATTTTPTPE